MWTLYCVFVMSTFRTPESCLNIASPCRGLQNISLTPKLRVHTWNLFTLVQYL